LNAQQNASSHIAFTSLVTVCWIEETASILIGFVTFFNSGNKEESASIKARE
jgi:hypothetical protein